MNYYDLTDTLEFIYRVNAITGIQRVVLSSLKSAGKDAQPIFIDFFEKKIYQLDLNEVDFITLRNIIPETFFTKQVSQLEFNNAIVSKLKRIDLSTNDKLFCLGGTWNHPQAANFINTIAQDNVPVLQFIHDLIPISHQHLFPSSNQVFLDYFKNIDKNLIQFATSTEHNKGEVEKNLFPNKTVEVLPLGDEFFPFRCAPEKNLDLAGLGNEHFVLMLGTIEPRKHHEKIVRFWIESELFKEVKLMICGIQGWGSNEFAETLKWAREKTDRIFLIENIYDDELINAYKHCYFAIYPSMLEGWGLPVSEAKSFNKYCITGEGESLKHHENGIFIDFNKNESLTRIKEVYSEMKSSRLNSQFLSFSWYDFNRKLFKSLN